MDTFENATPPQEQAEMVIANAGNAAEPSCASNTSSAAPEPTFTPARSVGLKLNEGPHERTRSRTVHVAGHWVDGRMSELPFGAVIVDGTPARFFPRVGTRLR